MIQADKLRAHQVEPAKRLLGVLAAHPSAVDFSDTGTGKTYVAMAVANALKLPTLVICPKIVVSAWQRVAAHFGDTVSAIGYEKLRTGRTPFGQWDNTPPPGFVREEYFQCQCCQLRVDLNNFQPCYTHAQGIHCIETKTKSWKYGEFHFHPAVKLLIFDEVHRCGGIDSLNAKLLIAARRQGIKTLALSATGACSPLGMQALGYLLDLHALKHDRLASGRVVPSFYRWASRYECRPDPRFRGFKWFAGAAKQVEIMRDIRNLIIPSRGVRVTTDEIPGFPEREISAELYDMEESGEIDKIYADMADALAELEKRQETDVDHPLTIMLRAQQKIELLKVPVAVELTRDFLDKGKSVALFVNYRQTLVELAKRLNIDCIIDGSPEGVRYREANIARFQRDEARVILVNAEAGGVAVSLHDVRGVHPRVGIDFPNFSARTMKQVFGRLHRDGAKSKCHYRVIFAANTIEERIYRAVRAKLNNLDALNDADLMPENLILRKFTF